MTERAPLIDEDDGRPRNHLDNSFGERPMTNVNTNGQRKTLASQLDRLDTLEQGLQEAVASAVQEAVGIAVPEAISGLVREVLRQWQWPARKSAALREPLASVLTYFGNNVHRMAYPEYGAEGWHIGSGVVESACKTVVGQRRKGPGMCWGEGGAHALCPVRALDRSEKGQGQAFGDNEFSKPFVQQAA